VPMLPLTLIPRPHWKLSAGALFTRLFITDLAVTQFLLPYPVAGSQTGLAAAPMILWAFLCITDGINGLRKTSCGVSWTTVFGLRLDELIGGAILIAFTGMSVIDCAREPLPPASLGLKGSEWLHLPVERARQIGLISASVNRNCHILFTMPGMGSFNIWSGVPTPNGWNFTAWTKGVDLQKQAGILNILKLDAQACAIVNHVVLHFWGDDETTLASLPLAHYVTSEMLKVAEVGDYEIRVHPQRSSPWASMSVVKQ
jgi:hypothetical protein